MEMIKTEVVSRKGSYRKSRFLLEIGGTIQAGFSEATIPGEFAGQVEYIGVDEAPTRGWSE